MFNDARRWLGDRMGMPRNTFGPMPPVQGPMQPFGPPMPPMQGPMPPMQGPPMGPPRSMFSGPSPMTPMQQASMDAMQRQPGRPQPPQDGGYHGAPLSLDGGKTSVLQSLRQQLGTAIGLHGPDGAQASPAPNELTVNARPQQGPPMPAFGANGSIAPQQGPMPPMQGPPMPQGAGGGAGAGAGALSGIPVPPTRMDALGQNGGEGAGAPPSFDWRALLARNGQAVQDQQDWRMFPGSTQ